MCLTQRLGLPTYASRCDRGPGKGKAGTAVWLWTSPPLFPPRPQPAAAAAAEKSWFSISPRRRMLLGRDCRAFGMGSQFTGPKEVALKLCRSFATLIKAEGPTFFLSFLIFSASGELLASLDAGGRHPLWRFLPSLTAIAFIAARLLCQNTTTTTAVRSDSAILERCRDCFN